MSDHSGPDQAVPPLRLAVRVRCVLRGGGKGETHTSVFCPRREASVGLDACAACELGVGLSMDSAGHTAEALCAFHPEGADRVAAIPAVRDDDLAVKLAVPVSEIMTRSVICVSPEMTIAELRSVLIERGIGGVPVVDASGCPIGVVSKTDVLRVDGRRGWHDEEPRATRLPREAEAPGTVAAIMTALALAIHETSNVAQASALMAYEGVHRLPVVDDLHRVVGVLSALDILHWLGQRSGYLMRPVAEREG
ncbi:MAG: CBS domain-containing protein [Polyangiaceae bacterium]|nr:CBS domain-containing protein [Polyangiaceae bacterium]